MSKIVNMDMTWLVAKYNTIFLYSTDLKAEPQPKNGLGLWSTNSPLTT